MNRILKGLSASVVLALVVSVFAAVPVLAAAKDARVDVGTGLSVTVTNVVDENPAAHLYVANAPATVTFEGTNFGLEKIEYYRHGELWGNSFVVTKFAGRPNFDVMKYTYYGNPQVHDALVEMPQEPPLWVTGNRATLTNPGFYAVVGQQNINAPQVPFFIKIAAQTDAGMAVPAGADVFVDGRGAMLEAYNVSDNYYFKLRDVAMAMKGTQKPFEVKWDGEKNAIYIETGKAYTSVGGESSLPQRLAQSAVPTAAKVYVNGQEVQFTAFNVRGNNYFKLRDLAKALNVGITWDSTNKVIQVNSGSTYTE